MLTPGIYNSAYFEHAFLAQQLGVELVEGNDLVVLDDDCVYARTIDGLQRVDVIYRRIDDLFLDPEAFRPDSMFGRARLDAGLAGRAGRSGQRARGRDRRRQEGLRLRSRHHPVLPRRGADPRTVPTLRCGDEDTRRFVLDNLPTGGQAGQRVGRVGRVVGTQATAAASSRTWPARSTRPEPVGGPAGHPLSTAPTLCEGTVAPRHVDLRPFTLLGPEGAYVTRGGLTRVARRPGSLVVNSSQGGGSKDTWVVDTSDAAHATLATRRTSSRSGRGRPGDHLTETESGTLTETDQAGHRPSRRPRTAPRHKRIQRGSRTCTTR